jgi:hypothetical protein
MSKPKEKKKNKVKKTDYLRVLVTETLPYETPIIFSNEGFYNNLKDPSSNAVESMLIRAIIKCDLPKQSSITTPFSYKIRKNAKEFRRLSLLHPLSQWKMSGFYQKYENILLHFCSRSEITIRSPKKIASTFYTKNSWENIHQYKTGAVSEEAVDRFTKYSPSFFAYRGFDRLYKFFESSDFFKLEKQYTHLWTLDVSKCFDSIYTHCLSWAVKDKNFTKANVDIESTFGQSFDILMRHANHNETNGIVIGPEISRIFAEILFQTVDVHVRKKLSDKHKFESNRDYAIRRYVDDVFIFGPTEGAAQLVYDCYADTLLQLNLHANSNKTTRLIRPFLTKKSRIINDASAAANAFIEKFTETANNNSQIIPKKIYYNWRLARSFIDTIKSICSHNDASYDDVSSYLISIFTERVKKFANVTFDEPDEGTLEKYRDCAYVFLEILYFLYSVSPSVSASYKLCINIIVLVRFFKQKIPGYSEQINHRVYELTNSLLSPKASPKSTAIDTFISLEIANIILASRELGEHYLLPEIIAKVLFSNRGEPSYFDIVCCLFYIRKNAAYKDLRRVVLRAADSKLSNLNDILRNAEKAHLFLDLLACPYIFRSQKKTWISRFFNAINATQPSSDDVNTFLDTASRRYWFVNWEEVDLLNSLEKKELKRAY